MRVKRDGDFNFFRSLSAPVRDPVRPANPLTRNALARVATPQPQKGAAHPRACGSGSRLAAVAPPMGPVYGLVTDGVRSLPLLFVACVSAFARRGTAVQEIRPLEHRRIFGLSSERCE